MLTTAHIFLDVKKAKFRWINCFAKKNRKPKFSGYNSRVCLQVFRRRPSAGVRASRPPGGATHHLPLAARPAAVRRRERRRARLRVPRHAAALRRAADRQRVDAVRVAVAVAVVRVAAAVARRPHEDRAEAAATLARRSARRYSSGCRNRQPARYSYASSVSEPLIATLTLTRNDDRKPYPLNPKLTTNRPYADPKLTLKLTLTRLPHDVHL